MVSTVVIDQDHRVIIWNMACERLAGLVAEAVVQIFRAWNVCQEEKRPESAFVVERL